MVIQRIRLPRSAGEWGLLAYTGFLTITLNYALVFWGEQYISSGLAALLSATVPLFGLPPAHRYLTAESSTRRKIVGVLLGLTRGGGGVFRRAGQPGGPRALAASAGIIAAALATAHASVLVKSRGHPHRASGAGGNPDVGGMLTPPSRRDAAGGKPARLSVDSSGARSAGLSHHSRLGDRFLDVLLAYPPYRGYRRLRFPWSLR